MGDHVQKYYDMLKKEGADRLKKQFSQWTKCLEAAKAKNIPELMAKVHASIRAKPARVVKKNAKPSRTQVKPAPKLTWKNSKGKTWTREKKVKSEERKAIRAKLLSAINKRYGRE